MPAMSPACAANSLPPEHALPVVIVLELFEMHHQESFARATKALNKLSPLALAVLTLLVQDAAQAQSSDEGNTLPSINVTAPAKRQARASIAGLGDGPAWQQPVQAQSFSEDTLKDAQATRLADLTKLDASTTDSYNTIGYWDYLTIRGFTLDNAYNYRREGLPINAETRLPMDNKASVELLKGTSGMQAGVSAPGGLVNLVVKRPEGRVRTATVAINDAGGLLSSVDLADRFGSAKEWGLRINAAAERMNTHVDNTHGHRRLLAVAADRQLAPGHLVEVEYEHSFLSQPSVPGMSLLGNALPSARTFTNINFNKQAWTQPVQLQGDTGTIRLRDDLGDGWQSTLTYGEQRLKSNDRAAFPFGCTTAPDYSDYVGDRYCADGRVDLSDFRSDDELRLTRAMSAQLQGQVQTGNIRHDLSFGVLRTVHLTDQSTQAYNYVGTGNVADPYAPFSPAPDAVSVVSDRHERTTEWTLQDAMTLTTNWHAWVGMRHTHLKRQSDKTDGSGSTVINQDLSTPWAALGWTFAPQTQAYVSWGEGAEVKAAPTTGFNNSGEVLPAIKSRQVELGIKSQQTADFKPGTLRYQWGGNVFHINRPEAGNVNGNYAVDGSAVHRGLEGYWQGRLGAWSAGGSAMVIDAKRSGSTTDGVNGKRPVNVPYHAIKLSGAYSWTSPYPLTLLIDLVHEGARWVDADNTISLPSWTRADIGVRTTHTLAGQSVTWRLGVTNLFNQHAWRESPTSFGHIYLFPMQARTFTASAQIDF